jgi:hypothetical protein
MQWNPSSPVLSALLGVTAKRPDEHVNQSVSDRKSIVGHGKLLKPVLLTGAVKERGEYSQATVSVRGEQICR